MTAKYLETEFGMSYIDTTPMGIVETGNCIKKIEKIFEEKFQVEKCFNKYIITVDLF